LAPPPDHAKSKAETFRILAQGRKKQTIDHFHDTILPPDEIRNRVAFFIQQPVTLYDSRK
jgi:hypothetical protein